MISWLSGGGGWGTREQAIPGEWAALVLIMVLGALLGLLVLWFTVQRHERTLRRRAARRPDGLMALTGIGAAADERAVADETADGSAAEESGAGANSGSESESESESGSGAESELDLGAVDEEGEDGARERLAEESAPEQELKPKSEPKSGSEQELKPESEPKSGSEPEPDLAPAPESMPASESESESASASGASAGSDTGPGRAAVNGGKRKLTDEILSRVESELAGRAAPRWKELAELVEREFGVTAHPSSIQKAVKRRRLAAVAHGGAARARPDSTAHRAETVEEVRPNGGRQRSAWASPAYPAADAG